MDGLSISFGGGPPLTWGIGVESRTPGACQDFTMTVTVMLH